MVKASISVRVSVAKQLEGADDTVMVKNMFSTCFDKNDIYHYMNGNIFLFSFRLDSLLITEPSESAKSPGWKLCGTNIPPSLISKGHILKLHFKSDATISDKGFKINYNLIGMLLFYCNRKINPFKFKCGSTKILLFTILESRIMIVLLRRCFIHD